MSDGAPTTALACSACGAPLVPVAGSVRVSCTYCGTVNDIASAGAVQVAKKLEQFGIRVPETPLSIAEIEADLARRDAAQRQQRRMALIATGVILAVVGVIALVVALAG